MAIKSLRKTGQKISAVPPAPPGTEFEEVVETVPGRYNGQPELTVEIKPGNNTLDLKLDSK